MSNIIEVKDVLWEREHKSILKNVNWTIRKGEHWALLGLNGSGKTTLLNMITGYIWPTKGEISVLGHQYGTVDLREMRKRIGWVSSSFQERIHPNEKTQHLVISGLHASVGLFEQPTEDHMQKAVSLMETLGCAHLLDRPYQTCSQGEKQKLLIARALMASPDLLILDEAGNGLDFLSRESLLQSIASLVNQKDAPTLLYVTHHVEEILPEFTHSLLLRKGTVFASGKTEEILTSEQLSALFETPVQVSWKNNRAWLSL
ncbi:ABC transporter ATP-binding protein [Paenibacillus sp. CECT 9249]|uniref:ABC transporter ATP-binding protein n=1 Tax=unclassified Paenibacillus TaxID=185978 RepID=UPI001C10D23D|nr:ABC transporter ATP-binding protein [Paenibacillus sp. CECT 9249]MBU5442487.1 ABC transporter ATP-binding protein [Paenibacillus sp. MSJ-34]CAH0120823.1 putative ABC transporter ATP-binding protein YlmA [Paenibacillus sp. CECT 9249]